MDFRTEWSSWVLILLMVMMAAFINPYAAPENYTFSNVLAYILPIFAYPFIAITLSCIPVLIVCWIIKVIPDIDYAIRLGFLFMLIMVLYYYV